MKDEAAGRGLPEDLGDKNEAQHETIGVGANFIECDWALQPGTKFGEASLGEGKHDGAPAIGGLVLERANESAAAEAVQRGINGTRRVGIVAKRSGGEILADRVAGGGLLLEHGEEEIFEIGKVAHNHTQRAMNRTPRTVGVK